MALELVRRPAVHDLKTWPEFFQEVKAGRKTYEIRENDRDFHVGDLLRLHEYIAERHVYTGDVIEKVITYMTGGGNWGLPSNLCVLALGAPPEKGGA